MLQRIASYIMVPDSSSKTFDVEDVLSKLTTDEKIALLSGITVLRLLWPARAYSHPQVSTSGTQHQ
jgi:hypothetical protein